MIAEYLKRAHTKATKQLVINKPVGRQMRSKWKVLKTTFGSLRHADIKKPLLLCGHLCTFATNCLGVIQCPCRICADLGLATQPCTTCEMPVGTPRLSNSGKAEHEEGCPNFQTKRLTGCNASGKHGDFSEKQTSTSRSAGS